MTQDSFSEKERRCRKRRKQNKEIQKRLGAFSIKARLSKWRLQLERIVRYQTRPAFRGWETVLLPSSEKTTPLARLPVGRAHRERNLIAAF